MSVRRLLNVNVRQPIGETWCLSKPGGDKLPYDTLKRTRSAVPKAATNAMTGTGPKTERP
jgi:hypothetical protein